MKKIDSIDDLKLSIGNRLEKFISSKNMTNKDFADSIGFDKSTLSRVTTGKGWMSINLVYEILNNYELDWNWLIAGTYTSESPGVNTFSDGVEIYGKLEDFSKLKQQVKHCRELLKERDAIIKDKDLIIQLLQQKIERNG